MACVYDGDFPRVRVEHGQDQCHELLAAQPHNVVIGASNRGGRREPAFSDAMDENGRQYGLERLQARLGDHVHGVEELGSRIVADVRQFIGKQKQFDDLCLVCCFRV